MPPQGGRGEAGAIIMGPVSVSGQIRLQAKSGAPFAPKINFVSHYMIREQRGRRTDRSRCVTLVMRAHPHRQARVRVRVLAARNTYSNFWLPVGLGGRSIGFVTKVLTPVQRRGLSWKTDVKGKIRVS